jgi:hypothetical protein
MVLITFFGKIDVALAAELHLWLTPKICIEKQEDCTCYTRPQITKIYEGLRELDKCQATVMLKADFITSSSKNYEPLAWWQEPTFVVGGIIVSASLAAMLTYMMVHK